MIRAAIFDGPGRPLRVEALPRPMLAPGEALVRVSLATICGSDLHTVSGRRNEPTPSVLGHEAVGIVEEIAADVRDLAGQPLRLGERVVWTVAASCGACFFCHAGLPQKCTTVRKYGHAVLDPIRGPSGGLATHVHLWPGTGIVKVPDELPDEAAAPAACATATVAAVLRVGGPGRVVLVSGAGMLGLTACAMANAAGMTVIAVDRDRDRLEQAAAFGATLTFHEPDQRPDLADFLTGHTPGGGADLALELTGAVEPTRLALDSLRIGGTLVLAGAVFPTAQLSLSPEQIVRRMLTLRGVHNYTPADLQTAVAFLATQHKQFPFAELVPRTFSLDAVNDALHWAEYQRPFRVGIRP